MSQIDLPDKLTAAEELLVKTYARLRKKKEAVQAQKAAAKQRKEEHSKKRAPVENADEAKEHAKRLLLSGRIKLEAEKRERQSFKRTRRKDSERGAPLTFQPFEATKAEDDDLRNKGDRPAFGGPPGDGNVMPVRRSTTVRVSGEGMTEEKAREALQRCGNIKIIATDPATQMVYVTFEAITSADEAVTEINEAIIQDQQFHVSFSRRPQHLGNDSSATEASLSWTSIAASTAQKGHGHKDTRGPVKYDDFFSGAEVE